MSSRWKRLEDFHQTRSDRERVLILTLSLLCIYFIFSKFFLVPVTARLEGMAQDITLHSINVNQSRALDRNLSKKIAQLQPSNIAPSINELNAQIQSLDDKINELSGAVSSPEKTISFIQDIFSRYDKVHLRSIRNSIPVREESMSNLVGRDIYLHNVTLEIEGTFKSILGFLDKFEQKQPNIPAYSLHLEVREYPLVDAHVSYHLYSFKKDIIGV